jgi:hypothetical protein
MRFAVRIVVTLALGAISLGACNSNVSSAVTPSLSPTFTPIDGFRDIKFGTSFKDLIGSMDVSDVFNPFGLRDCFKDLPLKGCFLSADDHDRPYDLIDGIPYTLSVSFNRLDKLTDVDLGYRREGDITKEQCLSIHGRTVDWVAKDYGRLTERTGDDSDGKGVEQRSTPAKTAYRIHSAPSGSFVTSFMRTGATVTTKRDLPITAWDNHRYVSTLTSFIVVDGKAFCDVTVGFSEPATVERRAM